MMLGHTLRCSPDCEFEDCIILVKPPKGQPQEGEGDGNSNERNDNNSDNSSADNGDSQSDSNEQGGQGDAQGASEASGDSQESQEGSGSGNADSSDGDSGSSGEQPKNDQNKSDSNGGDNKDSSSKSDKKEQDSDRKQKKPGQDGSKDQQKKASQARQPVDYKPKFDPKNQETDKKLEAIATQGKEGGSDDTEVGRGKHDQRIKNITDAVFTAKLRNVMKDNAYDRRVKGRKRGKLDMKSLYKVPAKAENVFTLKEARKNKHYNIILLVDQSGSMSNSYDHDLERRVENQAVAEYHKHDGRIAYKKIRTRLSKEMNLKRLIDVAADCAVFLAKSLDKVDINYGIVGYSGRHWTYKTFDQHATPDKLDKVHYDLVTTGRGGTNLSPALDTAYKMLKKEKEGKNIIISVSDGRPFDITEIKKKIKGNSRDVEYVDIGIKYKPIMPDGFTVNNVNELKPLLINQLRKRITRG